MVSQLFPDFTLLDIYKDARIVDIIRNPGAITVYKREGTGHAVEVGGFRFSNQKSILMADDAAAVSACFRSVNSIEVGAGYPCTFDPKFLIRFESKSKLDVVDFLCGRDCYLVDWYFNFHQVDGSVSRLKMNHLGISILEAVFESASLGSAKTQDTK